MQTFINLYGMMVLDKGADEKDIRFVLKADHLAALEAAECSNGELTIENDVLKAQIAALKKKLFDFDLDICRWASRANWEALERIAYERTWGYNEIVSTARSALTKTEVKG